MIARSPMILLTASLLGAPAAEAAGGPLEETFTAFVRCDASFFRSLHRHADAWRSHARLDTNGDASWIQVDSRADQANSVSLRNSPSVSGLPLETFFDTSVEFGTLGKYLRWGFTVDAPFETTLKRLLPLIENPEQLASGPGRRSRSEIPVGGDWTTAYDEQTFSSQKRMVARLLMLESEAPGKTTISCSLQGVVDATMLEQLRPDIARTDYPPSTVLDPADVTLSPGVRAGLDIALLAPKFTSLTYRFTNKLAGRPEALTPALVEMTVEDGLINRNVTFNPSLRMDTTTKAGLFQLKSSIHRGGRVLLTRRFELNIPGSWNPGSIISAKSIREFVPAQPGDVPLDDIVSCRIGERYPASRIHAGFQGDAIALDCSREGSRNIKAFIEDLGVSLDLEGTQDGSALVNRIVDVQVIR